MANCVITIDEQRCKGCGYCVEFCPLNCLEISDKASQSGYYQPIVVEAERCNACGVCVKMCPHWAIEVKSHADGKNKVIGPPRSILEPPLASCPGCQHPTVGRLAIEALDELGIGGNFTVLEAIPCAISTACGMDFGRKLTLKEKSPDLATDIKRSSPEKGVLVIQGYWGLADFSFDISSLIGALIRGENFTMLICNMPYYSPRYGRPSPVTEPAEGRLEPSTIINTTAGQKLLTGGQPLHIAELAAMFKRTSYSARGAITSLKDYQRTKTYIKNAVQRQSDGKGLSLVEIISVCGDLTYADPVDCLKWVRDKMTIEFPLGVFID